MPLKYLPWDPDERIQPLPAEGTFPAAVHVFDQPSVEAVNAALAAGRPLLVRGEPGTGKSQLARAAAAAMRRPFVSVVIDARTEARDLLWSFDAVARLAEAQIQQALGTADEATVRANLREERFLAPGPLWWAFDWERAQAQATAVGAPAPGRPAGWTPADGVVLLVDEIDKADSSVPNGLLEAFGLGRFPCPGGATVSWQRQAAPLLVVTTNEERALPDPFLRRCLVLHLSCPDKRDEIVPWLVERGRAHFARTSKRVLEEAAGLLATDREAVRKQGLTPPGGAEYLDLLRALDDLAPGDEAEQRRLLGRLRGFAFAKHPPEGRW